MLQPPCSGGRAILHRPPPARVHAEHRRAGEMCVTFFGCSCLSVTLLNYELLSVLVCLCVVAGIPPDMLVEAHGTFATATCTVCLRKYEGEQLRVSWILQFNTTHNELYLYSPESKRFICCRCRCFILWELMLLTCLSDLSL